MTLSTRDLPDVVAPFTREQFVVAGGSRRTLDRWLARGLIRPVLYGVYVPTETPDDLRLGASADGLVLPRPQAQIWVADHDGVWVTVRCPA